MPVQLRRRFTVLTVREPQTGQQRRLHAYPDASAELGLRLETPHGSPVVRVAPGEYDILEVRQGRAVRTRVREE